MALPEQSAATPPLEISASQDFSAWLREQRISIAFTTYQTCRIFFVGSKPDGRLAVFERFFDRAMGLAAEPDRLHLATRCQIWRFDDVLEPGEDYRGYDRLYVPRVGYTTGAVDAHDVVVDGEGRIVFVNTQWSCLATLSERYGFRPLWKPPFVSALEPQDRCHLNGLAMEDGRPRYVTAVSRSDVFEGWRERRRDGGVVVDVPSGEIVASDLSMPHSPRLHRGELWLLNSGTGELGRIDRASGKFEPLTFGPGYLRGLAFHDRWAIIGMSKPRREKHFQGLELDDRLRAKDTVARCGLLVVDLETGQTVHWLELHGVVVELYDVQVLAGVSRPQALGFKTDEIQRIVSMERPEGGARGAIIGLDGSGTAVSNEPAPGVESGGGGSHEPSGG